MDFFLSRYRHLTVLLIVPVFAIAMAVRRRKSNPAAVSAVVMLVLLTIGYFFVYVLTPRDLSWHLQTSLERLMLQAWPLAVLAAGLGIRPAELSSKLMGR